MSHLKILGHEEGVLCTPDGMALLFSDRNSTLFRNRSFPGSTPPNPVLIWKDQARQTAFLPVERSLRNWKDDYGILRNNHRFSVGMGHFWRRPWPDNLPNESHLPNC